MVECQEDGKRKRTCPVHGMPTIGILDELGLDDLSVSGEELLQSILRVDTIRKILHHEVAW